MDGSENILAAPTLRPDPDSWVGPFHFRAVWLVDFEFISDYGADKARVARADGRSDFRVICMSARELFTGQTLRLWEDELLALDAAPFPIDAEVLVVAYAAQAEMDAFTELGWTRPARVLDLFAEHRVETNGMLLGGQNSMVNALELRGLPAQDALAKDAMRDLILGGGPWDPAERERILSYCAGDTADLVQLLWHMWPSIAQSPARLRQALARGSYAGVVSAMQRRGIPVDVDQFIRFRDNLPAVKERLVEVGDVEGVFSGTTFKMDLFEGYLRRIGLIGIWPRTPCGRPCIDQDTLRDMSAREPGLEDLRQLRDTLVGIRADQLTLGSDGRLRAQVMPFASITGRNQPKGSQFVFLRPRWMRQFIRPQPGWALAYIDYSSEEFAIGAALSDDEAMWETYASGDPYIGFGIDAGLLPAGATKASHPEIRDMLKPALLSLQYGAGEARLAAQCRIPAHLARQLTLAHRTRYARFWQWAEGKADTVMTGGESRTGSGWAVRAPRNRRVNVRTYSNFPIQATGADLLRLASCRLDQAGIRLLAPIHDALLIEARADWIDEHTEGARQIMEESSRMVLGGKTIRTDAKVIRHPERFTELRGIKLWRIVEEALEGPEPALSCSHSANYRP